MHRRLLTAVLAVAAACALTPAPPPPPTCMTSELFQVLEEWSTNITIPDRCALLRQLNDSEVECLVQHVPQVEVYRQALCATLGGVACAAELQPWMQGCPEYNGSCGEYCMPVEIFAKVVCAPTPSYMYNVTCSPCMAAYREAQRRLLEQSRWNSDQNPFVNNNDFSNLLQDYAEANGMCAADNGTLCLPLVRSLVESMLRRDSVYPTVTATRAAALCASAEGSLCLRRGLNGVANFINTQIAAPLALLNATAAAVLAQSASGCYTAAASLCASAFPRPFSPTCADALSEVNDTVVSCSAALIRGRSCSARCSAVFLDVVPRLGCCSRSALLTEGAAALPLCADFAAINASIDATASACGSLDETAAVLTVHANWTDVSGNGTVIEALRSAVTLDFNAVTGVSPLLVTNVSATASASNYTDLTVRFRGARLAPAVLDAMLNWTATPNVAAALFGFGWITPCGRVVLAVEQRSPSTIPTAPGTPRDEAGGLVAAVVLAGIAVVALGVGGLRVWRVRRAKAYAAGERVGLVAPDAQSDTEAAGERVGLVAPDRNLEDAAGERVGLVAPDAQSDAEAEGEK